MEFPRKGVGRKRLKAGKWMESSEVEQDPDEAEAVGSIVLEGVVLKTVTDVQVCVCTSLQGLQQHHAGQPAIYRLRLCALQGKPPRM